MVFRSIAEGVRYCHDAGVSHRDLKLDNILVNDMGEIKIIDFGFAVRRNPQTGLVSNFCGTPTFMSPEIVKRVAHDPHKADVWALGVILYKLLTDRFPFMGESDHELNNLILKATPRLEDLRPSTRKLLSGMLVKDERVRLSVDEVLNSDWVKEE